jgi:NitT/TauT family transport system substrate-binding protein
MAVKIERGGWFLIFLIGLALVGYALYRYDIVDFSKLTGGSKGSSGSSPKVDTSAPLPVSATSDNPEVRVRLNVWVGCAAGLVANGGLTTQPDSIFDRKGLKVSFKIIDDWTQGADALATGNVDVMLTTTDVYAKDYGQFEERGFGSHAFLMVDWSRGADGVIVKPGINTIEDLAGKKIAFAPYTPSHFLIYNGLKASGLSTDQRNDILRNAISTKDGIEPANLFVANKVDAAVAWDPDMSDAVTKVPGSKKIYDTRIANRLIADILIVSDSFAAKHPQTLVKFAQGWLEGVEFIKNEPSRAYNLIGSVKDFDIATDLAKTMLGGVKLADYADNVSFMGTKGSNSDYANIFSMAQDMYRELRMIKHTDNAEDSLDRRYIQQLSNSGFSTASTEKPIEYHAPTKGEAPLATQHRSIYFDPNSARMSLDSRAVVDEIGGQMRAYENTVVEIEGNTDSTGSRPYNMQLSRQRADAVKQYLMDKYGFPAARMRTAGNGPDKPIDNNDTPDGREKNRRTDIKLFANPGS